MIDIFILYELPFKFPTKWSDSYQQSILRSKIDYTLSQLTGWNVSSISCRKLFGNMCIFVKHFLLLQWATLKQREFLLKPAGIT